MVSLSLFIHIWIHSLIVTQMLCKSNALKQVGLDFTVLFVCAIYRDISELLLLGSHYMTCQMQGRHLHLTISLEMEE